jgi:UvrD-like helicase C-terminal domain/AAA domain
MSISAFDGAAGSGKTHSVFEQLRNELVANPLLPHQRVLALTYMHGSRHRLDEQLEKLQELNGRYEASTLDSFAWNICRRWRGRIRELGHPVPAAEEHDANCVLSALLLADRDVRTWVATANPIIIVDEAQDLERGRLEVVEQLVKCCCVLLAFDEFQCLNAKNRPVAVTSWIVGRCTPTMLVGSKRTKVNDLLSAALQIRNGKPLTISGQSFKVVVAPSNKLSGPVLAAVMIGFEMLKGGSFAILTPSKDAPYAKAIVKLLQTKPVGKKNIGPFSIVWERAGDERTQELRMLMQGNTHYTFSEIGTLLDVHKDVPSITMTLTALKRMRDAKGLTNFTSATIVEIFDRHVRAAKQFTRQRPGGRRAMTIHQAKNREFDRVAVVWPFKIPPSADDRRRLLYNAVTRARKSCVVVVQNASLKGEAPFT